MLSTDLRRKKRSKKSRSPDEGLLLVAHYRGQELVVRRSEFAKAKGVKLGMTLTHALAITPQAAVEPYDEAGDRAALSALGKWLVHFSPLVNIDEPPFPDENIFCDLRFQGIDLELSGSEKLFGGEEKLLRAVHHTLTTMGLRTRLAIAPTKGAAWALSRYGRSPLAIVPREMLHESLTPLPVSALRLEMATEDILTEVGIRTITQLLSLPRSALGSRFGGTLLARLDEAFGTRDEVRETVKQLPRERVELQFNGPTTEFESIAAAAKLLLEELVKKLAAKQKKPRLLVLECKRTSLPPLSKQLLLHQATLDTTHLWKVLRSRIEQLEIGFGIEALSLRAELTEGASYEQTTTHPTPLQRNDSAYAQLIDILQQQLGPQAIASLHCCESYVPEHAFSFTPRAIGDRKKTNKSPVRIVTSERPPLLFSRPESISAIALLPDHPPSWIKWKGAEYRVISGLGPERITTEWWNHRRSKPETRDYFRIQLASGIWIWVFRSLESTKWFVQGIWA